MTKDTSNDLYGANQKAQGIKFVITTVLVAIVVLGIAVWGIVFVVSNSKQDSGLAKTNQTEKTATADEKAADKDTSNQEVVEVTDMKNADATDTTEGVSASEDAPAEQTPTQETPAQSAQSAQSSNIPKTGPEDLLPVALLAGIAVAYFGSKRLANSIA